MQRTPNGHEHYYFQCIRLETDTVPPYTHCSKQR